MLLISRWTKVEARNDAQEPAKEVKCSATRQCTRQAQRMRTTLKMEGSFNERGIFVL